MSWLPEAAEKASRAPEGWIAQLVAMTLALVRYAVGETAAPLGTIDGGAD
jgi:hypothetical protein